MGCKIIFSERAIENLATIVRHVAQRNPEAAERPGHALIERVSILEQFPFLGSPYGKLPGVRKLVSRPYLILYRVRDRGQFIDILRYWHGAQQTPGPTE
jgi:addiction module RelE/StbE family toxin